MDQESLNSARDFRSRYEAEGEENYSSSYNIFDKDDANNKKTKIEAFTKERGFDEGFLMIQSIKDTISQIKQPNDYSYASRDQYSKVDLTDSSKKARERKKKQSILKFECKRTSHSMFEEEMAQYISDSHRGYNPDCMVDELNLGNGNIDQNKIKNQIFNTRSSNTLRLLDQAENYKISSSIKKDVQREDVQFDSSEENLTNISLSYKKPSSSDQIKTKGSEGKKLTQ